MKDLMQRRDDAKRQRGRGLARCFCALLVASLAMVSGLVPIETAEGRRLAVTRLAIDDVLLAPDQIVLAPGGTQQLSVLVVYDDGTTADRTEFYTIEVRDDDVAWVDENGVLHGLSEGRSHIDVWDDSGRRAGEGGDVDPA